MDNDQLLSVNRTKVTKVAFRVLDRLQDFPAQEQIAAVSLLFYTMASTLKITPQQLIDISSNISKTAEFFPSEEDKIVTALRLYVEGELS